MTEGCWQQKYVGVMRLVFPLGDTRTTSNSGTLGPSGVQVPLLPFLIMLVTDSQPNLPKLGTDHTLSACLKSIKTLEKWFAFP